MLTVQRLHDLLTGPPTRMHRGRLMAARDELRGQGNRRSAAQHRLLDALIDQPVPNPDSYRHPEAAVQLVAHKPSDLTPADLAWLAALPAPDKIRYRDAVELARFARQVKSGSSDERLVLSKWLDVKAIHDHAQAKVDLAASRQPWPDIPRMAAIEALNDAIAATTTELTDAEGRNRADRLADETIARRRAAHEQQQLAAEARLDRVLAAARDRESLLAPEPA